MLYLELYAIKLTPYIILENKCSSCTLYIDSLIKLKYAPNGISHSSAFYIPEPSFIYNFLFQTIQIL